MARVSVVSGGGTGIGRAVAAELAGKGDDVVIIGRRAGVLAEAARGIDGEVRPIVADLGEPGDVTRVRDEIARVFGRVDVLVNNAGGNADLRDPGGDGPGDIARQWTGNFHANVLTAVLPTEALRDLIAENGRVVLVSSIAAIRGSGGGSYGSVKAALHPYAYNLAAALGPRGITVNVVAPGFIEETEFFGDGLPAERRNALIGQTKTGRPGTPADVAATIGWLASPGAGHVTAEIIQVNGGAERGRAGPMSAPDGADAIRDAWRRELPGVPVDSIGVITRVWWAAKLLGDERRRTLARLGIDMATLDLLSTLRRSGPPYRMSPGELATACLVTSGAITQRVARATEADLVTRAASASGYHARAITLTPEGHELVESAVTGLLEYEQRLLGGITPEAQENLAALLRDLLATLTEHAGTDVHLGHVGESDRP